MRRQAAFTLIEVMVAFAILSGLLTLILQTQGEQARFLARSRTAEAVLAELQTQILALERGDTQLAWPAALLTDPSPWISKWSSSNDE